MGGEDSRRTSHERKGGASGSPVVAEERNDALDNCTIAQDALMSEAMGGKERGRGPGANDAVCVLVAHVRICAVVNDEGRQFRCGHRCANCEIGPAEAVASLDVGPDKSVQAFMDPNILEKLPKELHRVRGR